MMKIAIFIPLFFILSCTKTKVEKKDTTSNPGIVNPIVTPTPTPTGTVVVPPSVVGSGCYNYYSGGGTNYYSINAVFRGGVTSFSNPNWSSLTDPFFSGNNQNLLMTDGRFKVRVVVKPSPGGGPGNATCPNMAMNYTKLKFKVGIGVSGGATYYQQFSSGNINVDQCTPAYNFVVPATNNPLILKVYDVNWDACVNGPGTCAVDYVWPNDCVEMDIQISTDFTKDIP
jgi:hypothetical protein